LKAPAVPEVAVHAVPQTPAAAVDRPILALVDSMLQWSGDTDNSDASNTCAQETDKSD
jgi:hypothetical protein